MIIVYIINSDNKSYPIYAQQVGYDIEKKDLYFYIGKNIVVWLKDYYESDSFRECKKAFWKNDFATFDDLNYLAVEVLVKIAEDKIASRFPVIFIDECNTKIYLGMN